MSDTAIQKNVACAIAELDGQGFADMADAVEQQERELAAARAELAEARECLRDAMGWVEAPRNLYNHARWRKAAGVDTATPTNSGNS